MVDKLCIEEVWRMSTRIGTHLRELRKKRKLSLRKLGEAINVDYAYLSKIENGKHKPSIDLLEQIAEYFNVDVSYFFMNEELLDGFKQEEKNILFERELTPEALSDKYNLNINGRVATKEEIEEAIRYIEALRVIAENKKHSS
jgi:transcriptional regulator with XRE-family HTH domain